MYENDINMALGATDSSTSVSAHMHLSFIKHPFVYAMLSFTIYRLRPTPLYSFVYYFCQEAHPRLD